MLSRMHRSYNTEAFNTEREEPHDIELKDINWIYCGDVGTVYTGFVFVNPGFNRISVGFMTIKECFGTSEFIREIEVLKRLVKPGHVNVVQPSFMFSSDDNLSAAYVMPHMFATLFDIINMSDGPLCLSQSRAYTWQMFNGLQYIHNKGFIHRDVNPKNILIDEPSRALKICDFSCSGEIGEPEDNFTHRVTIIYRSPELLLETKELTTSSDIWSAGVCLGSMLRGSCMFHGLTKAPLMIGEMVKLIGMPTEDDLKAMGAEDMSVLETKQVKKASEAYTNKKDKNIRTRFPCVPQESRDFLFEILKFDPSKRLQGVGLLSHKFFADLFDGTTRANRCPSRRDLEEALFYYSHDEKSSGG